MTSAARRKAIIAAGALVAALLLWNAPALQQMGYREVEWWRMNRTLWHDEFWSVSSWREDWGRPDAFSLIVAAVFSSWVGAFAAWAIAPKVARLRSVNFLIGLAVCFLGTLLFVAVPRSWQIFVTLQSKEAGLCVTLSAYAQFAALRSIQHWSGKGLPTLGAYRRTLLAAVTGAAIAGVVFLHSDPIVGVAEMFVGDFQTHPDK